MIKRLIDWHLLKWKTNQNHKPLLIRGARQVGKTYAVRNLAKSFDSFVEINLELEKRARNIFEEDPNPERIMRDLSLLMDKKIEPGKTLLFIDEIQAVPDAIVALRYFYEKIPSLHVIAAGSLFDFALEKVGMPVGRVSSLYMYPCSFMEFLAAQGHSLLIQALIEDSQKKPFSKAVHDKLLNLLGEYLAIGGMPEALARWIETQNPKESFQVHHDLISSYRQDFENYASKHQVKYTDVLFQQIPYLVGEQFQYKNIHGEYRKRDLMPCLDLLVKANVIHKIYHSAGNGIPLGAEVNVEWFKLMFVDVALCQAILGLDLSTWFLQPNVEFVNRGAITESFVGQELLCYSHPSRKTDLFFWKRASKNSSAEVDFLYEYNQSVVPIEVKSGHGNRLTSMNLFLQGHKDSHYGIRFSTQNASLFEKIDSRPLYEVVSLAHADQKESLLSLMQK